VEKQNKKENTEIPKCQKAALQLELMDALLEDLSKIFQNKNNKNTRRMIL
jgi:hypothetical protein